MKQLINIDVPDLAAAERFYGSAFGLHRGRRLGVHVLEMLGGDAPVYLLEKTAGSIGAAAAMRGYHVHWTPVHWMGRRS